MLISFSILVILCTVGYLLLLRHYSAHWVPIMKAPGSFESTPFCSIIIAARNEEQQIGNCLHSVLAQDYPPSQYEVIVVDDGSEDDTGALVSQFQRVILLRTSDQRRGKKYALMQGIAAARGEIIITTDADCIAQPQWLHALVGTFDDQVQMVTGPVFLNRTARAFERFQALDVAGLALITASGIQSGLHHLANGANMAFRKSAFRAIGGFAGNTQVASGDDIFLVQHIAHIFPNSIRYAWSPATIVYTQPCSTLGSFFQQRLRWATKNKLLRENVVYRIWIGIWLTFSLNSIALTAAFFFSWQNILISLSCMTAIAIAEYFFLRRIVRLYKLPGLMQGFVLSFVMHFAYVLCIGIAAAVKKTYTWKGRTMR